MNAIIHLPTATRTLIDILAASIRVSAGAPKADVIRVRDPAALRAVRCAVAERARMLGATPEQARKAQHIALRELDAGRSPAVAIALACGELTGRRNPLLGSPAGA